MTDDKSMNKSRNRFRICLLAALLPLHLALAESEWIDLFNGKSLDGWTERNKSGTFVVEGGTIVGTATSGIGTTFLCTDGEYGDFDLEFECKVIDPELNSGVQIRSRIRKLPKRDTGPLEGPQVDISAKNAERGTFSGNIFGQGWGEWLTPKDKRRNHKLFKGGEWNKFRVLAKGDQVTTWINGEEVITTTIPAERHATHPGGYIALQVHAIQKDTRPFKIAWRNIRVRTLAGDAVPKAETKPGAAAKPSAPAERVALKNQGPKPPFRKLPKVEGLNLSYFAQAPEINTPVSVIAEPGGAVYALCDGNAGLGRLPNQGTVWRLVDENDDGQADYGTRFVPDIDTPRGGHFLDGTLYLVHPPFISSFRDLDGDGVADEHKVLAKGFAHDLSWKRGGDHTTNDLRIGIDGWIYVAVGDFGANAVGSDGSKAQLMTGGVIRMRKDGSDLEIHARGTRNIYDIAISPRLDILALDNTNDGDGWDMRLHHLTPLAHMGYPYLFKNFSEEAMPPLFVYGGGSGCGALYLEEPGFPERLNNRFHTINWGRVYSHGLTPHEATFVNEDKVTLTINKMVDLDVDGSSRLYFANFENGGARIQPGAIVGHIVQAKPAGWKYRPFPDLEKASTETLIGFLDDGSNVLRQQAQTVLVRSKRPETDSSLQKAATNKALSLDARIAALFAINLRNEPGSAKIVTGFLADESLREYALRALLDRKDRDQLDLAKTVTTLLDDANPRVRLQAVVGARRLGLAQLTEKLLAMSVEGARKPLENGITHQHEAIPHTAYRALVELAPVEELNPFLGDPEWRKPALAVLRTIHTAENVAKLTGLLEQSKQPAESLDFISALIRLYHREQEWDGESFWGTRPNSSGPYYQGVTWEESERIASTLRMVVSKMDKEAQGAVLTEVRRHHIDLAKLNLPIEIDPLEQLLEQPTHTSGQQADLLSIVKDPARPKPMRIAAFRAALEVTGFIYDDWCPVNLEALAAIENDKELHATLGREFVQSPSHRGSSVNRIPKTWSKVQTMGERQRALFLDMVCSLVQSPLTAEDDRQTLVNGMGKEAPTPDFIEAIARTHAVAFKGFLKGKFQDPAIARLAAETLASLQASEGKLVGDLTVAEASKIVRGMDGDVEEGEEIFTRQSCVACHSMQPDEPQKGPYLGSVGNLFNREQLITHIIDPGAEVAQGFQTYQFKLKDGTMASGFVTARDEQTIKLRNLAGESQIIQTSAVEKEEVLDVSMMPPGLVNSLTLRQFASLIDYLQTLH
jgi:putative heme-binding domain-containing protein